MYFLFHLLYSYSFVFLFLFLKARKLVEFRPNLQARVSLIKPASATTGRWFCASRKKPRARKRKKERNRTWGRPLPRISKHPERFSARKRQTRPTPFQTLMHKYRKLSSFARERARPQYTFAHAYVLFGAFHKWRTPRYPSFLRARGEGRCGREKKTLADFLASDVASPTL